MGRQIIRQPNGLLAEYSTIVDAFVMYDATPEELAQAAADDAAKNAYEETLEAANRARDTGSSSRTQFKLDWEKAYANHLSHGGEPLELRDAPATWLIVCEKCGLLYREDGEATTCPHAVP